MTVTLRPLLALGLSTALTLPLTAQAATLADMINDGEEFNALRRQV
ncbi:hypothetical protein [Halomonas sp. RA08-2]